MKPRSCKMFRKSDLNAVMAGVSDHCIFTVIVTSWGTRVKQAAAGRALWHYKMSVFGTS